MRAPLVELLNLVPKELTRSTKPKLVKELSLMCAFFFRNFRRAVDRSAQIDAGCLPSVGFFEVFEKNGPSLLHKKAF